MEAMKKEPILESSEASDDGELIHLGDNRLLLSASNAWSNGS